MINVTTDIKWNGKDVKIKGEKSVKKSVFEYGIIVESQAAALAPVVTGRLVGSITTQTKDKSHNGTGIGFTKSGDIIDKPTEENVALVGSNVDYSKYVEYTRPFLRPAIDITQGRALNVFIVNGRQELSEYLK